MKTFYNKVIQEFNKAENQQKFHDKGVPFVQYIDLYAGQEQFEENHELFAQPAILIDWDVDYKSDPATATVTIYACYEQLRDTSNISLNRDAALGFLDYVGVVDDIMQSIECETTGKLEIVAEGFNKMDSIVDIYLLTYECSYMGRKSPQDKYRDGDYDTLNLTGQIQNKYDIG